ncbi:hypothetical protein EAH75_04415 [Rhodanobacter glycinis]|uniref:hypothetical protein n=1 Tax=Rhodanobacter glycinis TaxID=582702 RepID=UPI00112BB5B0|nr:hypothetical protein [Rhodanobacter glycinis]TPG50688.1 hypothetical protein EAH75_04415 [Rhodanobacter glycinis]
MRECRSQIIAAHVALALSRCSMIERVYAQAVVDIYHERTPLHARTLEFHSSRDPYDDARRNGQIVKRLLDGRVRMPVDLEESLILALPQPYQQHLQAELAERLGLMAAELPSANPAGQQHQVGDLISDVGKALDRLSPMLDDGVLDERDAVYAEAALRGLEALQARAATLCDGIRQNVLKQGGCLRSVK